MQNPCFLNPPTNFLNAIDIANKCKSGVLFLRGPTLSGPCQPDLLAGPQVRLGPANQSGWQGPK